MKLLFVCESFPTNDKGDFTGGVENRDYFTTKELARNHHVTVITAARKNAKRAEVINGINVIRCGIAVDSKDREKYRARLSFIPSAVIQSLKLDFDLVHGSNFFSLFIASIISLIKRKPAFALIAGVYLDTWKEHVGGVVAILGQIIERYDLIFPWKKVIAISNTTEKKLIDAGVNKKKIKVIYGGLDLDSYKKIEPKKYSKPTVVFANRLVGYKRAEDLIRATQIVKKNIKDLQVIVIGTGEESRKLKKLSKELGLKSTVQFKGFIKSHDEVMNFLARSHIFCNPSVVEGFGQVTLEAMAVGTPFVNADIEVTREITDNGKGGLFFKAKDPQDLASQIQLLLADPRFYTKKQSEARKQAYKYDWRHVAQDTEKLFQKAIKR